MPESIRLPGFFARSGNVGGGAGPQLRIPVAWGSTMKKRRTKMNKHKLKKRRKAARMKSSAKQNA